MSYFAPETDPLLYKCGCQRPDCPAPPPTGALLSLLERFREKTNAAVIVNSGPRCEYWNKKKGGKKNSDHLTGEGADLKCIAPRDLYLYIDVAMELGIKRFGIGRNFFHVGVALHNPQYVAWTYY